jgi:hypothetical protein
MPVRTTYQAPTSEVQRAIHEVYRCGSSYIGAVPVIDARPDLQRLVMVTVMLLIGHPTSKHCYAWWSVPGTGQTAFALVLESERVRDAESAVKAWPEQDRRERLAPGGGPVDLEEDRGPLVELEAPDGPARKDDV